MGLASSDAMERLVAAIRRHGGGFRIYIAALLWIQALFGFAVSSVWSFRRLELGAAELIEYIAGHTVEVGAAFAFSLLAMGRISGIPRRILLIGTWLGLLFLAISYTLFGFLFSEIFFVPLAYILAVIVFPIVTTEPRHCLNEPCGGGRPGLPRAH